MKRWLSIAAVVVLCLALVTSIACGGGEGEEEEEGVTELKFGFGLAMTGVMGAAMGIPSKYAFEMSCDKIGVFEVAGKQYRWKPVFEENYFTGAGGVASANKFIYEHDVDFMFQAGIDPGMTSAPICEEVGMILDIAGANWDQFGPHWPHTFQIAATWALGYATFFDWLTKEHPEVKRVALAYGDDAIGQQRADAVEVCCEYYGLELKSKSYPRGTVEYYPLATSLMAFDPDLVIDSVSLLSAMWDMGYEGLACTPFWLEGYADQVGWDRCKGYLIIMPHPLGEPWTEATAMADEFEDRYGYELVPSGWWTLAVVSVMTDVIKQAGTVDDAEKIIETMESRAGFDSPVGPLYYGLQELNGVGHVAIWPSPIYEVVGEREYRLITLYTQEETEALAVEIFK